MSVRAIDVTGNWVYGIGKSAYITQNPEVAQSIKTRVLSFLGDCFFDVGAGIDWFNLLGSKNQIGLNLAVTAVIINTPNVTGVLYVSVTLDPVTRLFSIVYRVQSTYSVFTGAFQYDVNGSV